MTIAIISDTHIPDREETIPEEFRELIAEADHVVHAGDFTTSETLTEVRELASDLTAVHGNMDRQGIDLPTVASVEIDGLTLVVTHGTVATMEEWLDLLAETTKEEASTPRVGIGGHSHQLEDIVHDGVRLLNPGSVTGADPAAQATMLTATVVDDELDVTVHRA
jgi:hypothetical protein